MEDEKTPTQWVRLAHDGRAIYVRPNGPDWLTVSADGDQLLGTLLSTGSPEAAATSLTGQGGQRESLFLGARRLERLLNSGSEPEYEGRYQALQLGKLKECWVHLTDQCNLSCSHCLFSASPSRKTTLAREELDRVIDEARALGCRLFYFTGGEPFIYPAFFSIIQSLLASDPSIHVVVLTNGMKLQSCMEKIATMDRLHLQVSVDGLQQSHDRLRGKGTFVKLVDNLRKMRDHGKQVTLSVAVSRENIDELTDMVELAAELGVANIHLLYHFIRGKGTRQQFVGPAEIFAGLLPAWRRAEELGIVIDNVETLRSQVFSTPGTRYDLSNSGWQSLTVGPDGVCYPSPALVGLADCDCGRIDQGLAEVWHNSPVLDTLRRASLIDDESASANPLRFLIGGGDIDHSFMNSGKWVGHDPYVELYNLIALQLIVDQAASYSQTGQHPVELRMGDVRHDCPDEESSASDVALTHCNCVVSLATDSGHGSVREFYGQAALSENIDIVNPLAPQQAEADFIPLDSRKRSYGCGSPVTDARLQPGETLVDLGSGSGVECFMAAEQVGEKGQVHGIDMTDEMLTLAAESRGDVVRRLGYDNISFDKGFLEAIPLTGNTADAVISNCVINLSPDKRRTYDEIFRVLKPGGRLVVSDIITDAPIPATIKNNVKYRGECLGGAMQQEELVAMMEGAGFVGIRLLKRFSYRRVEGMDFFSLTYQARKPLAAKDDDQPVRAVYRGPHQAIYTEKGRLLVKGRVTELPAKEAELLDESLFLLDNSGEVTNISMENSCCAHQAEITPVESSCCAPTPASCCDITTTTRHRSGCMVCAGELKYLTAPMEMTCSFCQRKMNSTASCEAGHFVCDQCHTEDGLDVIYSICTGSREHDMLRLLELVRSHHSLSMHGPEHHALIPGVILACYRNSGGGVGEESIKTAIDRGAQVPGGVCGYWGTCGAAIGVGIGVSTILSATPLTPTKRQTAQQISGRIMTAIGRYRGGRCCQRESWLALTELSRLSADYLGVQLSAEGELACSQYRANKQCIRKQCPLWSSRDRDVAEPLSVVEPLTIIDLKN